MLAASPLSTRRAPPFLALVEAEAEVAAVVEAGETLTRAHVAHILVDTEELALIVAEQLDQGSDFAQLAETVSTCDSAARGGDLGWITPGMYVAEFDAVVFNSAPGETVVVDTPFGWHVIRVLAASSLPLLMEPTELKRRLAPGVPFLQLVDIRDLDELE
jgi:parvulin-like peptidyl-prolyl isomerase